MHYNNVDAPSMADAISSAAPFSLPNAYYLPGLLH